MDGACDGDTATRLAGTSGRRARIELHCVRKLVWGLVPVAAWRISEQDQ
jgi:hypothetical protein